MIIGIDPGSADRTGFALYEPKGKIFEHIGSCNASEIWAYAKGCELAVVEDPNLDKAVFGAWERMRAVIRQHGGQSKVAEKMFRKELKIAQDIGRCKNIAANLIEFLEARMPVARIAPSARNRADKPSPFGRALSIRTYTMPTKTTAAQFKLLTGHAARTNEHGRDAATMLWGKIAFYWHNFIKTTVIKK